jgi:uncharacterized protein YbaR (Trm112 family)
MKKLFLIIAFLLLTKFAFAEIPIYCPKCKTLLYYYQKDEIIKGTQVKAEDFKPVSFFIPQPQDGELLVCPFDNTPLNGWEYWGKSQHYKSFNMAYYAVSLLTFKDGLWVWFPFDMPMLNMNEVK